MSSPRVTVDGQGVCVHIDLPDGTTASIPLSQEAGFALLTTLAEKLAQLKTPEVQKKLFFKVANLVIDHVNKRKGE